MIRYNARDIFRRAMQIADLENSDFISDYEAVALMNESYTAIYNDAINAGARDFVRRARISNGAKLPNDFYMLTEIRVGNDGELLPKRTAVNRRGYEITNNHISFDRYYEGKEIYVEYVPTPKSIFLKRNKNLSPYEDGTICADGMDYVVNHGGKLLIRSIDGQDEINPQLTGISSQSRGNISIYGGLVFYNRSENTTNAWSPFSSNPIRTGIPVIYDNKPFVREADGNVIDKMFEDADITIPSVPSNTALIITDDFEDFTYLSYDDGWTGASKVWKASEGNWYGIANGRLIDISNDKVVPTDNKPFDISSGWALTDGFIDGRVYNESLFEDTELDFPNNTYYTALCYYLAMAFARKQGRDSTQIEQSLTNAMNTFYSSITRDANEAYVIRDVYSPNNNLWRS